MKKGATRRPQPTQQIDPSADNMPQALPLGEQFMRAVEKLVDQRIANQPPMLHGPANQAIGMPQVMSPTMPGPPPRPPYMLPLAAEELRNRTKLVHDRYTSYIKAHGELVAADPFNPDYMMRVDTAVGIAIDYLEAAGALVKLLRQVEQ